MCRWSSWVCLGGAGRVRKGAGRGRLERQGGREGRVSIAPSVNTVSGSQRRENGLCCAKARRQVPEKDGALGGKGQRNMITLTPS